MFIAKKAKTNKMFNNKIFFGFKLKKVNILYFASTF